MTVKMANLKWRKHTTGEGVNGVKLICGIQEVGYVFPSEDGHKWTGFLNALYHKKDYPNLKDACVDIEFRWKNFFERITEPVNLN